MTVKTRIQGATSSKNTVKTHTHKIQDHMQTKKLTNKTTHYTVVLIPMASSMRPFPDYFDHLLLMWFIETLGGHVLTHLSKLNGSFSSFHSCVLPGAAGPMLSLYMSPLILSSHSDQQPLDLADCKSMKKSIWCVLSFSAWTADCGRLFQQFRTLTEKI